MTAPKTCPRGLHLFAGRKCPACLRADAANAAALDELDELSAHKRGRRNRTGFLPPPESHPQALFRRRGSKS